MILRFGTLIIKIGGGGVDDPPPKAYLNLITLAVAKARRPR